MVWTILARRPLVADAHRTPPLAGKPTHWLLDAILPAPVGSGRGEVWDLAALHRTLLQTSAEPVDGPVSLADLHLGAMMAYFVLAPEGATLLRQYERLSRWWATVSARPSFAATDGGSGCSI